MFLDHLNGHTTQVEQSSGRLILKTPPYSFAKITSYVATGITLCVSISSYVGGVPTWKGMLFSSFICGTISLVMSLQMQIELCKESRQIETVLYFWNYRQVVHSKLIPHPPRVKWETKSVDHKIRHRVYLSSSLTPSKDPADVLLTTVPSYGPSVSRIAQEIATYLGCESFNLNKKV